MADEHGRDAKIIAVPDHDAPSGGVSSLDEIAPHLTAEIEHFFKVYKDLEPSKHSEVFGFGDAAEAAAEILRSQERAAAHHRGG